MSAHTRVVCAGEVMIELAPAGGGRLLSRGCAGDTFNTAVQLARQNTELEIEYLTRLGDDAMSQEIIDVLAGEGVGTALIERVAGRQPGLYLIENDANGERQFHYWRGESPARELFCEPANLGYPDVFYFSGITLAVTQQQLAPLVALLTDLLEHDCQIVFDPNYRARLWRDAELARAHYREILPYCHTVLPTLDDDRDLWGLTSVADAHDFYAEFELRELVIKGDELMVDAFVRGLHSRHQAEPVQAIDTTGAGDSFAAGYLAARLAGASVEDSIQRAQQLAARVVQTTGAIPPRD